MFNASTELSRACSLSFNKIEDAGAEAIGRALAKNKSSALRVLKYVHHS